MRRKRRASAATPAGPRPPAALAEVRFGAAARIHAPGRAGFGEAAGRRPRREPPEAARTRSIPGRERKPRGGPAARRPPQVRARLPCSQGANASWEPRPYGAKPCRPGKRRAGRTQAAARSRRPSGGGHAARPTRPRRYIRPGKTPARGHQSGRTSGKIQPLSHGSVHSSTARSTRVGRPPGRAPAPRGGGVRENSRWRSASGGRESRHKNNTKQRKPMAASVTRDRAPQHQSAGDSRCGKSERGMATSGLAQDNAGSGAVSAASHPREPARRLEEAAAALGPARSSPNGAGDPGPVADSKPRPAASAAGEPDRQEETSRRPDAQGEGCRNPRAEIRPGTPAENTPTYRPMHLRIRDGAPTTEKKRQRAAAAGPRQRRSSRDEATHGVPAGRRGNRPAAARTRKERTSRGARKTNPKNPNLARTR